MPLVTYKNCGFSYQIIRQEAVVAGVVDKMTSDAGGIGK
jgi:hypothetical protein